MPQDYPDFMLDVDRSPVQKLEYQIYGVHSGEGLSAPANTQVYSKWDVPDDDYYYAIDTLFVFVNHLFPVTVCIDLADDQSSPSWYTLGAKNGSGCVEMSLSRMGSFAIRYPSTIRFRLINSRDVSVTWNYYCNFYKYIVGG